MSKKFRNTKARREALNQFNKLWQQSKNKIYYRRKAYNVDFNSILPLSNKREAKNLSTKELRKINKQLTKLTQKDSSLFSLTKINDDVSVPTAMVREIKRLEKELQKEQNEIDRRDSQRKIYIDKNTQAEDSVLDRRLMSKPNPTLTGNLKPYDLSNLTNPKTAQANLQSAIDVRKNRLDPEWLDERQSIMMDNFRYSLITLFNDDADKTIELLNQISPSDFFDLYEQFIPLDFMFIPSDSRLATDIERDNLEEINDILQSFLNGEIDTQGKIFDGRG